MGYAPDCGKDLDENETFLVNVTTILQEVHSRHVIHHKKRECRQASRRGYLCESRIKPLSIFELGAGAKSKVMNIVILILGARNPELQAVFFATQTCHNQHLLHTFTANLRVLDHRIDTLMNASDKNIFHFFVLLCHNKNDNDSTNRMFRHRWKCRFCPTFFLVQRCNQIVLFFLSPCRRMAGAWK